MHRMHWLMERLAVADALAGDLLEEAARGRLGNFGDATETASCTD